MNLPSMLLGGPTYQLLELPGGALVLLVAVVGSAVGIWLLRRTWSWGDEYRSFRATDRGRSRLSALSTPAAVAIVVLVLGALIGAAWLLPATVVDLLF